MIKIIIKNNPHLEFYHFWVLIYNSVKKKILLGNEAVSQKALGINFTKSVDGW